jgi:hypothetical protein
MDPIEGEKSPNQISRNERLNCSSRREEAPSEFRENKFEPPHVGCYEVHGKEGRTALQESNLIEIMRHCRAIFLCARRCFI